MQIGADGVTLRDLAVELAAPGDVLVIDGGGTDRSTVWGGSATIRGYKYQSVGPQAESSCVGGAEVAVKAGQSCTATITYYPTNSGSDAGTTSPKRTFG